MPSVRELARPILASLPDEGEELTEEHQAATISALQAVFTLYAETYRPPSEDGAERVAERPLSAAVESNGSRTG